MKRIALLIVALAVTLPPMAEAGPLRKAGGFLKNRVSRAGVCAGLRGGRCDCGTSCACGPACNR